MLLLNENQLYADRYIFQRHFTEKKVYLLLKNQFKDLKDATFYVGHFRVYTDG